MIHGSGPDSRRASMFADLGQWSRGHGGVYEVRPALALRRGVLQGVGFEVTLSVIAADARPACAACIATFRRLSEIAEAAIPGGRGEDTACRLRGFDSTLRFRWDRGRLVPEVQFVIDIEHQHRYFESPGEEQLRFVHALQERLAALGFRPVHGA